MLRNRIHRSRKRFINYFIITLIQIDSEKKKQKKRSANFKLNG